MSESYYAVCLTCRKSIWLASASGFHRLHTAMGDPARQSAFEQWLAAHEPIRGAHDVRILWEQTELPLPAKDGGDEGDWPIDWSDA